LPGSTEICILGPQELLEPFRAVGLATSLADETNVLERAAELASSDYKIVFYAEEFYPLLRELLAQRGGGVTFIPIPSLGEGERYAMQRVRELIKKAIGVDVYWEAQ